MGPVHDRAGARLAALTLSSLSSSPAARAAARRAALPSISIRAWTTSRRCRPRRPARSSTTARPCASPFQERSPIGGLKEDTAFFTGKGADGQFVATIPVTVDEALVERGRQRYAIYCQPCHDARGDGKGILFQRGNVPTASFHQEKILKYPDGQIFDVITNGAGLMSGYRWPIPPRTGGRSSPTCGSSSASGRQRRGAPAAAEQAGSRGDAMETR